MRVKKLAVHLFLGRIFAVDILDWCTVNSPKGAIYVTLALADVRATAQRGHESLDLWLV
jgi:hypothetical protein